jgi:aminoglycoside 6'-N-acetyltransferase
LVDRGFDAYVMLLDDRPVGCLQCYEASPGAEGAVFAQPPGTRGLDLFIGERWALAQGHGSAFVRRFTEQLLATPEIRRVIADPAATNTPSIRCFETAGFRRDAEVQQPWGPIILMVRDEKQED